jgi:hypothetical protein
MRTWVLTLLLAVIAGGCAHGAASTGSPPTSSHATGKTVIAATKTWRPAWVPLVSLRQLGAFATRCSGRCGSRRSLFAATYVADPQFATESVTLWRGRGGRVSRTLQPGQRWVTPLAPAQIQRWRISQGTEPQTVTATVRIAPNRCPYGVPRTEVHFGTSHFNSAAP